MKWIGQHIIDFVARLRSDVYLDNPTAGGSDPDRFLGLDATKKVVYRTGAEVLSDIGAGSGTVTSVALTDDASDAITSTSGFSAKIAGGEGIDTTISGDILTVSGEDASTSNKGVASFSSNNFGVASGAVQIKSGGVDLTDEVTGTLPVGNGGIGATTLNANSVLTGNGSSAVQAETGLSYDSENLYIGDDDDGDATIRRLRHTDDAGGNLFVRGGEATGTDKTGGNLSLYGGRGTGTGEGGHVYIFTTPAGGSTGSSLNTAGAAAAFWANGDTQLFGNLIFEGDSPDAHETTFSITDPTADRTVTVPDADVDLTKVRAATTSLDGVVELATTGEADTGTAADKVVTPAGLESHVNTRYSYQYYHFHMQDTIKSNWIAPGNAGLSNHVWGTDSSDAGVTVGSSTMTCTTVMMAAAFSVPINCEFVGFDGTGHRFGGNNSFAAGVFVIDSDNVPYGNPASTEAVLRAYAAATDVSGNGYNQKLNRVTDIARSHTVDAGSLVFPAFKDTAGVNSGSFRGNMTMVFRTKLTT